MKEMLGSYWILDDMPDTFGCFFLFSHVCDGSGEGVGRGSSSTKGTSSEAYPSTSFSSSTISSFFLSISLSLSR